MNRPVIGVEDSSQRIMEVIDREGAPPMPLSQWVELLEAVILECHTRIQAARDDMRR
jgi:hypothetical protein